MTPDELRALLAGAAGAPVADDEVRAVSALSAGHALARGRRRRTAALGLGVLAAGVAVVVLPSTSPDTSVVLGCAPGLGTQGAGAADASLTGVTLTVQNPTDDVLPVSGGGATVLALPGTSRVTLPAGTSSAVCGSGRPVSLTVTKAVTTGCAPVPTAAPAVQRGALADLTLGAVGAVPAGSSVSVGAGTSLRSVQVRAGGALVAEALWHEMPGPDDWHLQSLSRCR